MTHFLGDAIADVEGAVRAEEVQRNIPPLNVHIVGTELDQDETPEFGSWMGYQLVGTETPFQLLRRAEGKRYKTQIAVVAGAAANTTGHIFIGSQNQIQNPSSNAGFLIAGQIIEYHAQQEVWCRPDGTNSLWVMVLEERYR